MPQKHQAKIYLRRALGPLGAARGESLAESLLEGQSEESLTAMVGQLLEEFANSTGPARNYAEASLNSLLERVDAVLRLVKAKGVTFHVKGRPVEFFEEIAGLKK